MKSPGERLIDVILVFCGGSLGTTLRYGLTLVFASDNGLPIIFAINVTGAFLLGILSERVKQAGTNNRAKRWELLVGTGALGGYTTYGTFAADAEGLLDASRFSGGIAYGLATVIVGVGAALAGTMLVARRGNRVEPEVEK